ncbi:uncharacterized protein TNCV_478881 [Trichonephila clavipes]|nr:uncharacterized protein TNCV_478881 [Trichonephila clavipes]
MSLISKKYSFVHLVSHHLSQCLDPADDLEGVFFHLELSVHVNKQTDLPAYLKQLTIEIIGDIPIDTRSESRGEIQTVARFFRSELIAIDEALGSLLFLPNGKEIWILSDSRSAIQHLSNWQNIGGWTRLPQSDSNDSTLIAIIDELCLPKRTFLLKEKAKELQRWLKVDVQDFIQLKYCTSSRPYLNQFDYELWSALEAKVY